MPEEVLAKSLLRTSSRVDSWFLSSWGMNLYRGCAHDCADCDGRAEKYRVQEHFASGVGVKTNALDVLWAELGIAKQEPKVEELWPELTASPRAPRIRPAGFVMVGGGVGDSYQPLEETYRLTRGVLSILADVNLPVHILTKSTLVLRDIDVLRRIDGSLVSFSVSSVDDELAAKLEPGASPPSARLRAISALKEHGIASGLYLVPVIPFLSDTDDAIEAAVAAAQRAGADFVVFGGMTMKEGRQKEHFIAQLRKHYPSVVEEVLGLYENRDPWGAARGDYYAEIMARFGRAALGHGVSPRIPLRLFRGLLQPKDLAVVLLEHIHAALELEGKASPYRYAAFRLSRLKEPMDVARRHVARIQGIGEAVASVIEEILDSGSCRLYEELMGRYQHGQETEGPRGN